MQEPRIPGPLGQTRPESPIFAAGLDDASAAGSATTGTAGPKLVCFEAIRGLAALAVVVFHLIVGFWPAMLYRQGPQWDMAPTWLRALVRFPGKFL